MVTTKELNRLNRLMEKAAKEFFLMSDKKLNKLLNPPPSVISAKNYYKLFCNALQDGLKANHAENLADILIKFRVVCSDYRFFKKLQMIGLDKKFAIHLMAFRLGFEPGQEEKHG